MLTRLGLILTAASLALVTVATVYLLRDSEPPAPAPVTSTSIAPAAADAGATVVPDAGALMTGTHVILEPTGLRYAEDGNTLTLGAETASDQQGPFYIVSVPGPKTWDFGMPQWSRQRRDAIIAEIKKRTVHERIKWVDTD